MDTIKLKKTGTKYLSVDEKHHASSKKNKLIFKSRDIGLVKNI